MHRNVPVGSCPDHLAGVWRRTAGRTQRQESIDEGERVSEELGRESGEG